MSPICIICRRAPATRVGRRYCRSCHHQFIANGGRKDIPADHPFRTERERRIERMTRRAELGLPIFEEVDPDLG